MLCYTIKFGQAIGQPPAQLQLNKIRRMRCFSLPKPRTAGGRSILALVKKVTARNEPDGSGCGYRAQGDGVMCKFKRTSSENSSSWLPCGARGVLEFFNDRGRITARSRLPRATGHGIRR